MNIHLRPISISFLVVPLVAFQHLPPHRFFYRMMQAMSSEGLTDIGEKNEYDVNPMENIMMSWRDRIDISISRSRKIRGSNYVQISTISQGEPRCRTVVFRGFQNLPMQHPYSVTYEHNNDSNTDIKKSCVMKMITDNRSNKVSDASQCSMTELVWWFPKSSEQYRVRGHLCFVGGGDFELDNDPFLTSARREQWGNLSDPAREQFFWQEPGIPYHGEPAVVPFGGRTPEGNLLAPPNTFLLMLLRPHYVDYLRLGDNFRQIDELVEGEWKQRRVSP
jgi:pyridoxamine 5'-phosphate oxidase